MIDMSIDVSMDDVQIFLMDGMTVNECVTENSDGSYTVFVNSRLCEAKRMAAIAHAFEHIRNDDFGKADVQDIEAETHADGGESCGLKI